MKLSAVFKQDTFSLRRSKYQIRDHTVHKIKVAVASDDALSARDSYLRNESANIKYVAVFK